tara:strand:- start:2508 stop:2885 length:378 start_codon:yes stop_codon:yes gene_type:complete
MTEETLSKDEQLFTQLVSSYSTSAWISLGKIKNPMTDKLERNLQQASYAIDMLDMLSRKMGDNLNENERKFLTSVVGDLKMNYMEESKKGDEPSDDSQDEEKDESSEETKEESGKEESEEENASD